VSNNEAVPESLSGVPTMTAILMLSTIAMAIMLVLALPLRRQAFHGAPDGKVQRTPADHAARLLAARYARGEITSDDYRRVREVLYS
jgi:uncharacterized membrane protein